MDLMLHDKDNAGEEFLIDIDDMKRQRWEEEMSKERKLTRLREQIAKKQEQRKNITQSKQLHGRDFYLRKVSAFLISSIFLSLASQQFFAYVYMHDFVAAYFDQKVQVFGGMIEGSNFCYLNYFIGKTLGFIMAALFVINHVQADEEIGRKVFSISLILSSMSVFVSTKLMHLQNWPLFVFFYIFVPTFMTGRR